MDKRTLLLLTVTAAAVGILPATAEAAEAGTPRPSTPPAAQLTTPASPPETTPESTPPDTVASPVLPAAPEGPPPGADAAGDPPLMSFCVTLQGQALVTAGMAFMTGGGVQNVPLLAVAPCPAGNNAATRLP
ncbi:hypothetical protein [Nonomuraea ceibae]|uniref:hypothetical protein n=1 Tax=Nonomuraea ceibae TaxID=1935170 RepID=UPI001C5D399A|nr:hypothetical protein [Nonomuraea ceibae]